MTICRDCVCVCVCVLVPLYLYVSVTVACVHKTRTDAQQGLSSACVFSPTPSAAYHLIFYIIVLYLAQAFEVCCRHVVQEALVRRAQL